MFNGAFYVELGGLASYGPDSHETGRLAARLVDKILKGENPGRIPVEATSKIELAVGFPTSFLIGRDGRAVARAIGPREWASVEARTLIESLLMEPTGRR